MKEQIEQETIIISIPFLSLLDWFNGLVISEYHPSIQLPSILLVAIIIMIVMIISGGNWFQSRCVLFDSNSDDDHEFGSERDTEQLSADDELDEHLQQPPLPPSCNRLQLPSFFSWNTSAFKSSSSTFPQIFFPPLFSPLVLLWPLSFVFLSTSPSFSLAFNCF